ncbi:NAD(P)/FAD-dependent oxidoreductase [Jannaschia aquimarina]|uniref:SoxA protein n=1 Tax=Jannaschia aquimarina TaxID=935700 RepID=A0A0D1CNX1_9RHOB|nr:FAD-dependent oxidoreductase [Jannaschia aquimarina]KIT16447.1 Monomeric sarcosine oxidase [Jannaschia aquimarina]SNS92585.1 sarcosine oxidase [Jannaschia aquimarina]
MERFDFIVVGGGMMGAPCARYLARGGHSVALVAAPEPASVADGPFGSHYDAGRITRHLSHHDDWSLLSAASMSRYQSLEEASGERIFTRTGAAMAGLRAGPLAGFTEAFLEMVPFVEDASILNDPAETGWHLPAGSVTALETGGGWIDPRAMARAQIGGACRAGAALYPQAAVSRDETDITLADGTRLSAGHVVVATGPHAASDGLLPARPAMTVWARTVAFIELDEDQARDLLQLPTLIWVPGPDWDHDLYALPPIRYPDGVWRMKVGGQKDGPTIGSADEMRDWFHGTGDADVGARLLEEFRRVLPTHRAKGTSYGPCAVTWTETGFPYIDSAGANVTILTGGNGAAAKCGDELGRLGALTATGTGITDAGYRTDFRAVWI